MLTYCRREYVRLGDVELNDAADGTKHTDISIEKIIPHPEFSRNPIINDLALIRLKVPVNYTGRYYWVLGYQKDRLITVHSKWYFQVIATAPLTSTFLLSA